MRRMQGQSSPIVNGFLELWIALQQNLALFSLQLVQALLVVLLLRFVLGRLKNWSRQVLGRRVTATGLLLINRFLAILALIVGVLWILSIFGVDLTALATVLGVMTVAVSLAAQDVLKNVVAGLYLLVERPFRIGQRIRVKDLEGAVEEVKLRLTVLRSSDGKAILVPNAMLFAEAITNQSTTLPDTDASAAGGPTLDARA